MATYQSKRFYRDALDKKLSGVCSGFAKRHQLPVWLTRVALVFLFISAPVLVACAYGICHLAFDEQIVV